MSALPYHEVAALDVNAQTRGLGFWQILTGIIGPLAEAGTTAYSTYAQTDLQKKELKTRRAEVEAMVAQRQREAELEAERQREELRLQAERAGYRAQFGQTALAVGALIGTTALVVWGVRRLRRGG